MTTYDNKTLGAVAAEGGLILPLFEYPCDEATFKASYIIASDIKCGGKITALFDLIVLGNIEAAELEVKGRFICTGKCQIEGTISVQNYIWAEEVRADCIEAHDEIIAQKIDVKTIVADGSIIVGKVLSVDSVAHCEKSILCGETAFGAGEISAHMVITGEPIDLYGGAESVIAPHKYEPSTTPVTKDALATRTTEQVEQAKTKFTPSNDWRSYLDYLIESAKLKSNKRRFIRWRNTLDEAHSASANNFEDCYDISMIIWLAEISCSDYFSEWKDLRKTLDSFGAHFIFLQSIQKQSLVCSIDSYAEWLKALDVLRKHGKALDEVVYQLAFDSVVSHLGLKAKFVSDRLNEKGWKAHG